MTSFSHVQHQLLVRVQDLALSRLAPLYPRDAALPAPFCTCNEGGGVHPWLLNEILYE